MRKLNFLLIFSFVVMVMLGFIMEANYLHISNKKTRNYRENSNFDFEDNNEVPVLESLPIILALNEWTFMVYLDADNNLEGAGIDDINEMEMIASDSNINVIVQRSYMVKLRLSVWGHQRGHMSRF